MRGDTLAQVGGLALRARARDLGISDGTAPADEAYLGFHLPAGNGRLAVVARLELQADGAGAHVGDGQVGRRAGQLWGWHQSDIFRAGRKK